MKNVIRVLSALLYAALISGFDSEAAQNGQGNLSSELKKLERLVGSWNYEGLQKDSPFGPAGTFAGKSQVRPILNGFAIQGEWQEKNPSGPMHGLEIHAYDAAAKKYLFHSYDGAGNILVGTETMSGNEIHGSYTLTDKNGKVHQARAVFSFAADNKSFTGKWEGSTDGGKTWSDWFNIKFTRT